jgi:starch synthase
MYPPFSPEKRREMLNNRTFNEQKRNILIVSSEMNPLIKTGGLADVVGALSAEMIHRGHDVRVVLPKYSDCNLHGLAVGKAIEPMGIQMGTRQEWCSVFPAITKTNVPVYLIEHDEYFARPGLYHDAAMNDYPDNPRRFAFLTRAALQLCKDLNFSPHIVHSHDWQTALAPAYLKIWDRDDPVLGKAASILTIHNASYQGIYPKEHYDYLGLGGENFVSDKFENFGCINFLKGGIHYAHVVNTVSPGYAEELRNPRSLTGLAPYLSKKGTDFFGILNGVDYGHWSPERDNHIPARFSSDDMKGKDICKRELQKRFLLEERKDVPLVGTIGRFVHQKGYHLMAQVIDAVLRNMAVQCVVLGSGENEREDFFRDLPKRHPGRAGSHIGFHNELAHLIEAGCDFFLMPSLYEPCGLNQLYSMRYGTLPIVHATGGLDDTVINYDEQTGRGTGFKFYDFTEDALYNTIGWAVSTYYDRPAHMKKIIAQAMKEDFSWAKSIDEYAKAYELAMENKKRSKFNETH